MIVAGEPFPSLRFWAELRFVRRVSMQCRFRLFIDSLYPPHVSFELVNSSFFVVICTRLCLTVTSYVPIAARSSMRRRRSFRTSHMIFIYSCSVCSGCCTVVAETSSAVPHNSEFMVFLRRLNDCCWRAVS